MAYSLARCLVQDCKCIAKVRGCCLRHYKQLQERVKDGKLTWEEAESRGLCHKAKPRSDWMVLFGKRVK